jgi:hypothetical protein
MSHVSVNKTSKYYFISINLRSTDWSKWLWDRSSSKRNMHERMLLMTAEGGGENYVI